MKELYFKHIDYFYSVMINGEEKKVMTTDARLDYKKYIAKVKSELGPDTKVWIKPNGYYHWTECTSGNMVRGGVLICTEFTLMILNIHSLSGY